MYNNNINNNMELQRQESLKRRWHDSFYTRLLGTPSAASPPPPLVTRKPPPGLMEGGDLVMNVVPSVTVVLEDRSICHRVNLSKHANYQSLARALRRMFAETLAIDDHNRGNGDGDEGLDLSNAIPGHLVAYEDMENDLLLAGDLNWKDFVRVAKRIRILPVKANSRKQRTTKN